MKSLFGTAVAAGLAILLTYFFSAGSPLVVWHPEKYFQLGKIYTLLWQEERMALVRSTDEKFPRLLYVFFPQEIPDGNFRFVAGREGVFWFRPLGRNETEKLRQASEK